MAKSQYPRWLRILKYNMNCMWYHVLFPLGQEEDTLMTDLKKMTNNQRSKNQ